MSFRPNNNFFLTFILSLIVIFSGLLAFRSAQTARKTIYLTNHSTSNISLATPFNPKLTILTTHFPNRVCNLTQYGGIGDGKTKNTRAFRMTISDCARQGGGKVIVPTGTWLTGPIQLESNINLVIQKGAQILFTTNYADYLPAVFSRFEGVEYYNYSPPIYAKNAENIAITGEGSINGQGEKFWWKLPKKNSIHNLYKMGDNNIPVTQRIFRTPQSGLRPTFVEFVRCNKVLISGITIINGPMWTVHPLYSQNIIVKNIKINTSSGPSTDGVNFDSSQKALVEDSTFSTGDDAIAIKSGRDKDGRRVGIPSQDIVLRHNIVNNAHGAVAIGSEMSGNVKNIFAQDFIVNQAQYGFRIKSNIQRGGTAKNIWLKDFKIDSLSQAVVQFNTNYERGNIQYQSAPPLFQNIHIDNVTCHDTKNSLRFLGLTNKKTMANIYLTNIHITKSRNGLEINNTNDINLDNISLASKYGFVFNIKDSKNISLINSHCVSPKEGCLTLKNNQKVILKGNNF